MNELFYDGKSDEYDVCALTRICHIQFIHHTNWGIVAMCVSGFERYFRDSPWCGWRRKLSVESRLFVFVFEPNSYIYSDWPIDIISFSEGNYIWPMAHMMLARFMCRLVRSAWCYAIISTYRSSLLPARDIMNKFQSYRQRLIPRSCDH